MQDWKGIAESAEAALDVAEKRAEQAAAEGSAAEAAETLIMLRGIDELCSAISKRSKKLRDEFTENALNQAFDREGVKTLTTKSGFRVTATATQYAALPAKNREAGIEWLRENGHDDVPQLTVNAQTLKSLAKNLAEDGFELPDDIFNCYIKLGASVTKV